MEASRGREVNNDIYHHLGDRWYTAKDDPVALLRAEARARNPWVIDGIKRRYPGNCAKVLDVGCGAGFLSNALAAEGFEVSGIDSSPASLIVARAHDESRKACYLVGDANRLPFPSNTFDAVCAMDFLEHVPDPKAVITECSRVLRPGGLFYFHTFNRNLLSWLIAIKGVELVVSNTPRDLHVYGLFIKPSELREYCDQANLKVETLFGLAPQVLTREFWHLLATGEIDEGFAFRFVKSTLLSYIGYAIKK